MQLLANCSCLSSRPLTPKSRLNQALAFGQLLLEHIDCPWSTVSVIGPCCFIWLAHTLHLSTMRSRSLSSTHCTLSRRPAAEYSDQMYLLIQFQSAHTLHKKLVNLHLLLLSLQHTPCSFRQHYRYSTHVYQAIYAYLRTLMPVLKVAVIGRMFTQAVPIS